MVSYGEEAFGRTQQPYPSRTRRQQMWQAGALFGEVLEARGEQRRLHHSAEASAEFSARRTSWRAGTPEMALTSWPTASSSARSPLPVFAEVIDQN